MNSVSDALYDGRQLRALTVVDAFPRKALAIEQGIKSEQAVAAMMRIAALRGAPKTIRADSVPKFISKALDRWAHENGVTLDFSRTGKPTDDAFVESFNGRLRNECPIVLPPVTGRRSGEDRSLVARLQREPPSHSSWLADASRCTPKTRITPG